MGFFSLNSVKVCTAEQFFEELEPRIVLDASLDAAGHDNVISHDDYSHQLFQGVEHTESPGHDPGVATHQPLDQDFNVVLISDRLPDLDMLQKASADHATVIVYDGVKDNLDTVNIMLQHAVDTSGKKIDHLAVLDHAKAGQVWIGADKIDLFGAQARRPVFESLGQKLNDGAQIQLYGCSIAGDPMGQALIDRIALYTHSDVFASLHKIGKITSRV
jgi:large repetitive protein